MKEQRTLKGRALQRLGAAVMDSNAHQAIQDTVEAHRKKILAAAVAQQQGISEAEAMEQIVLNPNSPHHERWMLISEIADLRRRGQFRDANALEKDYERRYAAENKEEYQQYRRWERSQRKAARKAARKGKLVR